MNDNNREEFINKMASNPKVIGALLETLSNEISKLNFRITMVEEVLASGFSTLIKGIKYPEPEKLWDTLLEVAKKEETNE